jgi:hypothetical protein
MVREKVSYGKERMDSTNPAAADMSYVKKLKPQEFRLWRGKGPALGQLDIELTEPRA